MKKIMTSKQGMISLYPLKNSFKTQFGISYHNDKVRFSLYLPIYIYTSENDSPKLTFDELSNYVKYLSVLNYCHLQYNYQQVNSYTVEAGRF